MANQSFESVVLNGLAPKVADTVLKGSVLTLRVLGNAKPWRGKKIAKAFKYAKATNGSSFSGLDVFNTNKTDNKRQLEFECRAYVQPVVIEGLEADLVASDPNAAVDLTVSEMESAGDDMVDGVSDLFYGDGTGNSNKDFFGLRYIVDDASVAATYGGKSRSTFTTLQARRYTPAGGLTSFSTLATAENAARYGTDRVTLHVTGDTKWTELEALIQPTLQTNVVGDGNKKVTRTGVVANESALKGEAGFDALYFRGAPVVADQKCPDLYWFGLNEKHLQWYGLKSTQKGYNPVKIGGNTQIEGVYSDIPGKNMGMNWSGFMSSRNQYGQSGFLILLGNLISFNPNRHFQIVFGA